jgi:hypothetical protein
MRTLWGAVCTGPGGDGARARESQTQSASHIRLKESRAASAKSAWRDVCSDTAVHTRSTSECAVPRPLNCAW